MALKRSRKNTEQRFQDAVLELVAESGCAHLGVNLVAQRAGSDKVLIYRYFGGIEGLLQSVAESRTWLPEANELLHSVSGRPAQILSQLASLLCRHIRMDATTHQLSLWRRASANPLTRQYTRDWDNLWLDLGEQLGRGLAYQARQNWARACALLALTIEADLAGESIDSGCLELLGDQLEGSLIEPPMAETRVKEDVLPTNLL
ncbi:MAG: TetR/AcrR family transcriptional regulator [Opitutales bacterium]